MAERGLNPRAMDETFLKHKMCKADALTSVCLAMQKLVFKKYCNLWNYAF